MSYTPPSPVPGVEEAPPRTQRGRPAVTLAVVAGALVILGAGVGSFFAARQGGTSSSQAVAPSPSVETSASSPSQRVLLLEDPVCHRPVNPATAQFVLEIGSQSMYFDTLECLNRFKEEPGRYARVKVRVRLVDSTPSPSAGALEAEVAAPSPLSGGLQESPLPVKVPEPSSAVEGVRDGGGGPSGLTTGQESPQSPPPQESGGEAPSVTESAPGEAGGTDVEVPVAPQRSAPLPARQPLRLAPSSAPREAAEQSGDIRRRVDQVRGAGSGSSPVRDEPTRSTAEPPPETDPADFSLPPSLNREGPPRRRQQGSK